MRYRILLLTGIGSFVICAALLVAVLWMLRPIPDEVARASKFLVESERLLSEVRQVEAVQRAFLLSGTATWEERYREALKGVQRQLDAVEPLVPPDEAAQDRWTSVRSVVSARLARLELSAEMRKAQGLEAVAVRDPRAGLDIMQSVGANLSSMQRDVTARVGELARDHAYWNSLGLFLAICLLVLVSAAVTVALLRPPRRVSER